MTRRSESMQRVIDRSLLAAFGPIWVLCLVLSGQSACQQRGTPTLAISTPPTATAYPVVSGMLSHAAAAAGLRTGDRLLQFNTTDLRGVGPVAFTTLTAQIRGPERRITVRYERSGTVSEVGLALGSYASYWPRLPAAVVFAGTAVLLAIRSPASAMIRAFVTSYCAIALLLTCTFAGAAWETVFSIVVHLTALALATPFAIRGALLFPHGQLPSNTWARRAPWLFSLLGPLDVSRFFDLPFPRAVGKWGTAALSVAAALAILGIVTHAYRQADAIGRRQVKWFVFGLYCAFAPPLALSVLSALDPRFTRLLLISVSTIAVIPITLVISIARYNLFDIDRLISATASYTVLGVALLGVLMAAVPGLARTVSGPTGIDPSATQFVLSVLVAALLLPAHRRLQPRIDQVFFPERRALEQGFQRLLDELSNCTGPEHLTRLAGERVQAMLRPETCVIYARTGDAFAPVFAHGRAIPPALAARSPLVAALETRGAPLMPDRLMRTSRTTPLNAFDRAVLETLGVPLVVPVCRGGALIAFLCIGPKRSGDIYTPTEVAMLAATADKVSSELLRFDQAEVLRRAEAMQASLRRYVPAPVVDRLATGRESDLGERELTVLFVDLRGYSTLAEARAPETIFTTLDRFTETVSAIIRRHGGSVVEFTGDGVMAVFGVPDPLPDKACVAVRAAREIVDAVGRLRVADRTPQARLSVGVGIATGPAFVGNVHAVDRLIWTAVGRTVNLAARLQALTRDLNVAIVADTPTWAAAGPTATDFQKHAGVTIRGHTQPEDVYALPLRVPP